MFTQCRGCGEIFTLLVDDVVHAHGKVRCNVCGTVFDALETLSAEQPHEDDDLILHDNDNPPPLLTRSYDSELENSVQDEVESLQLDENSTSEEPEFISSLNTEQPEAPFVTPIKKPESKKPGKKLIWILLSLTMLTLLVWQTVVALQNGAIILPEHQLSERICQTLLCSEQRKKANLDAISLISRNIRPHPGRDQALIISASMINSNHLSLSFPALQIKLSDLNGKPMAMRRFLPEEYLPEEILEAGFLSDTLIPFTIEVQSPGDQAVAFEIDFVQP